MAENVPHLVQHLESLSNEDLERFKVYLEDHIPPGLLKGADRTNVADLLVSSLGEREAWKLTLGISKKLDWTKLQDQVRKEYLESSYEGYLGVEEGLDFPFWSTEHLQLSPPWVPSGYSGDFESVSDPIAGVSREYLESVSTGEPSVFTGDFESVSDPIAGASIEYLESISTEEPSVFTGDFESVSDPIAGASIEYLESVSPREPSVFTGDFESVSDPIAGASREYLGSVSSREFSDCTVDFKSVSEPIAGAPKGSNTANADSDTVAASPTMDSTTKPKWFRRAEKFFKRNSSQRANITKTKIGQKEDIVSVSTTCPSDPSGDFESVSEPIVEASKAMNPTTKPKWLRTVEMFFKRNSSRRANITKTKMGKKDERNKYHEQVKNKFQLMMRNKISHPGKNELFPHQFTQLLFVLRDYHYKEPKDHELLVHGWKQAAVRKDQRQFTEVSDIFNPHQKTGIQPRTVVLQGAAGIGKTTLTIKVMLDWAEGKFYQEKFAYVFYLTCRELNPLEEKIMSFADLIANDWPCPPTPMTEIMAKPERLLFIIDGLDELKFPCNEPRFDLCKDWKQQRPVPILLSSLLRKVLLPEASLLLTIRLTALGKFHPLLENPHHVEILGFPVKYRKEYFCKFFRDKSSGEIAFSLVEDNATLLTMCSIPLMNWIVCTCLKQQMEKVQKPVQYLKTTTALYMCYINLIISNDKNFAPQHLKGLCHLAAEGIWERKLLFEEEDLRRHDLEAASVSAFLDMNIFQKVSDSENCYSFIHLSFQEFFAALFYVMSTDKEGVKSPDSIPDIKKLLEECSRDDASFLVPVVRFLFGFLNAETAEAQEKFKCRMSPDIKSQLLHWIEGEAKSHSEQSSFLKNDFPEWYSHLYETQDAECVTQALVNMKEIKVKVYHQYDALRAVYCISHCSGAQKICLTFNFNLPDLAWQDLISVISKNQNLKELKLCLGDYESCLEDFGEKLRSSPYQLEILCVALRNPNYKLEKLKLDGLKVTYVQCQYLCSAPSLKSLHLKHIFFVDDGKRLPWEKMGKKNCQLQTLSLVFCHLFPAYFQNFFSALNSNESLKTLDLSGSFFEEGTIEVLCEALRNQNCKLETLSLQYCHLSPTCFQNLFSALSSNKSLKNLDLSGNSFEEGMMNVLCEALGNPNCKIEKLRLHFVKLREDLKKMFEDLLKIKPSMKIIEICPDLNMEEKEHQKSIPEEEVPQIKLEVTSSQSFSDSSKDEQLDLERWHNVFLGPNGPVQSVLIGKSRNRYRVRFPMAGFYHCLDTGLGFSVRSEVTVDIEFDTWNQHLDGTRNQCWMIAGPLFKIRVDPGIVTSVHLPHFVYLQGGKFDVSLFKIVHFEEEGMVLESPTKVESSHAILENPSFSPIGVLLRIMHSTFKFIPIYTTTLIYHRLRTEGITLHLYLIPSDSTVRQAIDDDEARCHFSRLQKPSPLTPLYIGSRFILSGSNHLEIMPTELELCYRSVGECQHFSEIYSNNLNEKISLNLKDQNGSKVWEIMVRSGDLDLSFDPVSSASTGLHFVDQHRDQIISRVTSVDMILDRLYNQLISNEEYEQIRAERTSPERMRQLFSISISWDRNAKDFFYKILQEIHPQLMNEIQNS